MATIVQIRATIRRLAEKTAPWRRFLRRTSPRNMTRCEKARSYSCARRIGVGQETIFDVLSRLGGRHSSPAVGDIHIENYGTWRDVDGRLAWGVNDFDEAAEMPYLLDLVRLAVSALLGRGRRRISDEDICAAILNGYRRGLHAPQPVVLDSDKLWLCNLVVISERERAKFWKR